MFTAKSPRFTAYKPYTAYTPSFAPRLSSFVGNTLLTLPPGHVVPEVSFIKLADNTPMKLSDYRGKIVVLEFWAVWGGP